MDRPLGIRTRRNHKGNSLGDPSRVSVLGFFLGLLILAASPAAAQPQVGNSPAFIPQVPQAAPRTTYKILPEREAVSPGGDRQERSPGMTYVALTAGLSKELVPTSLEQLQALERQQAAVAEKIEAVTVNVQQGSAQGSGVIITPDGYVLTAAHVAGGANREASILLSDGRRVRAIALGMNRNRDAGLMKIVDPLREDWPHASLGQSSKLRIGEWVVAAGHPGGWKSNRGSVIRVGRVRRISYEDDEEGLRLATTLHTDCALIGGDSGGPLFNLEGKLVGIHSRIGTDVIENMHVPVDVYRDDWNRMVDKEVWGFLPGFRPVIGVRGTPGDERPLISKVTRGSPAHRAGVETGDLVLRVDGKSISTFKELKDMVDMKMPGETMILRVKRGERILKIPLIVDTPD